MHSPADASLMVKVEELLEKMVTREPLILSAALMTAEGFPLVVLMGRKETEKVELAAAISSLGALSEQTTSRLRIGSYKDLMLRGKRGHLIVRRISTGDILAVVADHKAQLGACFVVIDATAKKLGRLLK